MAEKQPKDQPEDQQKEEAPAPVATPSGETLQSLQDEPVDQAGHSAELHPELAGQPDESPEDKQELDQTHRQAVNPDYEAYKKRLAEVIFQTPQEKDLEAQAGHVVQGQLTQAEADRLESEKRWPWVPLNSGQVARARYLADQRVIEVDLVNDQNDLIETARHRPCKPTLWDAFIAHEDPGKYYQAHISNVPRD